MNDNKPTIQRIYPCANFFKTKSNSDKLMQFVRESNYTEAQKLVDVNSQSIFEYSLNKKLDGTYETISPLKLALRNLDSYMWNIFYEKSKDNIQTKKLFIQQLQEQTDYFQIDSFKEAAGDLFEIMRRGNSNRILVAEPWVPFNDVENVWIKVFGKAQSALPMHILYEFCRPGTLWTTGIVTDPFDFKAYPPPTQRKIFKVNKFHDDIISSTPKVSIPESGLGLDCTLMTYDENILACKSFVGSFQAIRNFENDWCKIIHIYNTRERDLFYLRAQLQLPIDNQNKTVASP